MIIGDANRQLPSIFPPIFSIIATAYGEKGELQKSNMVTYDDFVTFLHVTWSLWADEGLSLVVHRKEDREVIAVALNMDFFTILDVSVASGAVYHMLEYVNEIKGNTM